MRWWWEKGELREKDLHETLRLKFDVDPKSHENEFLGFAKGKLYGMAKDTNKTIMLADGTTIFIKANEENPKIFITKPGVGIGGKRMMVIPRQGVEVELVLIFGVALGDSLDATEGRIDEYLSAYPPKTEEEEKLNEPFYMRKLKDSISVVYGNYKFTDVPDNAIELGRGIVGEDWQPNKFDLGTVSFIPKEMPPFEIVGLIEQMILEQIEIVELKKISRFYLEWFGCLDEPDFSSIPEHYTGGANSLEEISSEDILNPGLVIFEFIEGPALVAFWVTWDAYGNLSGWYPEDDTQEETRTIMKNNYTAIILDGVVWKERTVSETWYQHSYLHSVFHQPPQSPMPISTTNSENEYTWTFSGEHLSFLSAQYTDDPKLFMVLWAISDVSINLSGTYIGSPPVNAPDNYPEIPQIPSHTDHTKYYLTISGEDGETDYLIYEGDYEELGYIHLGIYQWGKTSTGSYIPVYIYSVVKDTNAKDHYALASQKMVYGMIFKGKHYKSPEFTMDGSVDPDDPYYSQYFHRFVDGEELFKDGAKTLARGWFKAGRLIKTKKYERYIDP